MQPESAKYLRDMLVAAESIQLFVVGRSSEEYLKTQWIRDASNWNFCVIGEALSQLKKFDEPTAMRITDCSKIIGLRNQLIHGYGIINHQITWDIISNKLPVLIRELAQLLVEETR